MFSGNEDLMQNLVYLICFIFACVYLYLPSLQDKVIWYKVTIFISLIGLFNVFANSASNEAKPNHEYSELLKAKFQNQFLSHGTCYLGNGKSSLILASNCYIF